MGGTDQIRKSVRLKVMTVRIGYLLNSLLRVEKDN